MNVLHIIGNGLDISLGMKTDYQSFYDYYSALETKDADIINLKASVKEGRYKTWADLEAGLGDYTKNLSSEKVFLKCLEHMKSSLGNYLKGQFDQRDYQVSNRFLKDFYAPEQYLDEKIKERFDSFADGFSPALRDFSVRVVTLNYTSTIEDIHSLQKAKMPELLHLHGSVEDGMVMGVSDKEQIVNEAFRKSRNVTEDFVKPSFNEACLNNNNAICEKWIKEADLIVLFGTSLGETDRKWWRMIGQQLLDGELDTMLIYFAFDKEKDCRLHPNHRLRWTEELQKELLTKLEIPESRMNGILSRICIGINKPIFHLESFPLSGLPPKDH